MRCLSRASAVFAAILFSSFVVGCVQVPSMDTPTASVPMSAVVARVKCEIADAFKDRLDEYKWIQKWTVQADLNLIVNDQSAINPGAVLTQPLTSETLPLRGTFPRNFNLGVGAGVSTTAMRSEIVSFSMSLHEVQEEMSKFRQSRYHNCEPQDVTDLGSGLGLHEWIDSVFGPIHGQLLTEGYHTTPKGPGSPGGGKQLAEILFKSLQTTAAKTAKQKNHHLADLLASYNTHVLLLKKNPTQDDLKTIRDDIDGILLCLRDTKPQEDGKLCSDLTPDEARALITTFENSRSDVLALINKPLDPPIDALSHQVQFLVAWSGSVNPSWTLVHFKGPSPSSGSFLSASQNNTHTLTIVVGPPNSQTANNIRSMQGYNAALYSLSNQNRLAPLQ